VPTQKPDGGLNGEIFQPLIDALNFLWEVIRGIFGW
jgi:hypothetical protein